MIFLDDSLQEGNTTRESEVYLVELSGVTILELVLVTDISRGATRASLKSLLVSRLGRLNTARARNARRQRILWWIWFGTDVLLYEKKARSPVLNTSFVAGGSPHSDARMGIDV